MGGVGVGGVERLRLRSKGCVHTTQRWLAPNLFFLCTQPMNNLKGKYMGKTLCACGARVIRRLRGCHPSQQKKSTNNPVEKKDS